MKFLSKLFTRRKESKAFLEAQKRVWMILENEQFQLDMAHPLLREMIESGPAYDKDPNGTGPFGFSETNPIPVNGPIGQLAYLSKLETGKGDRILFHRIGAVSKIDAFEAVTFSGSEWHILFLDLYHPRRSCLTPDGFRFTEKIAQFSGFHSFCSDFPYDFPKMKQREARTGLSAAYIAISQIAEAMQNKTFERPLAHKQKLDVVKSRLTSFQGR